MRHLFGGKVILMDAPKKLIHIFIFYICTRTITETKMIFDYEHEVTKENIYFGLKVTSHFHTITNENIHMVMNEIHALNEELYYSGLTFIVDHHDIIEFHRSGYWYLNIQYEPSNQHHFLKRLCIAKKLKKLYKFECDPQYNFNDGTPITFKARFAF